MTITPICPGCRARQRLLLAVGCDAVLLAPEPELPEHMSNCPARTRLNLFGVAVETWLQTWNPGPT